MKGGRGVQWLIPNNGLRAWHPFPVPSSQGVKPGDICPLFINSHSRENGIPEQIAQRDLFLCRLVTAIRSLEGPSQVLHSLCCLQCPVPVRCYWRWLPITSCEILGKLPNCSDFQCYGLLNAAGSCRILERKKSDHEYKQIAYPSTWQVTDKW